METNRSTFNHLTQQFTTSTFSNALPQNELSDLRLGNFFNSSRSYFMIYDMRTQMFEFVHENIQQVLGYDSTQFTSRLFLEKIHVADLEVLKVHKKNIIEFANSLNEHQRMNYLFRNDFRLKNKQGDFIRILQKVMIFEVNECKEITKLILQHEDISGIKKSNQMTLSYIGMENEPSYLDVKTKKVVGNKNILTKRERQILNLLSKGFSSADIAHQLFISVLTVQTHRKNILSKTKCKSVLELIVMAKENHWIE